YLYPLASATARFVAPANNDGCMDAAICPVDRGMMVAGTALTVETCDGDNFPIHVASYSQEGDGYVMVIDGKGYTQRAYLGDLIMGACQAAGFEGIVIDGYTRDRDGNIELGFPVWSRGFMPRGPIKKNEGNINTVIECAGVTVSPGDLVVGDSDGVCVIPRKYILTVLDEAEKKLEYENNRTRTIEEYRKAKQKGTQRPELAPKWVLDMLQK
ncbi:MAG: RraA family protein, partial [Bullifex sp.]